MTDTLISGSANTGSHFHLLSTRLINRFDELVAGAEAKHLFTTDATGLYEAYLNGFTDPAQRQHHSCNCCRRFIETYGGLVVLTADGTQIPAFWNRLREHVPPEYHDSVFALDRIVSKAKVTGVFASAERPWGMPQAGGFEHFYVNPGRLVKHAKAVSANQCMATLREDFRILNSGMDKYKMSIIELAIDVIKSDSAFSPEKFLAPLTWFQDRFRDRMIKDQRVSRNRLWLEVTRAPVGWCHFHNSVVASLIDDLANGAAFEKAKRSFGVKTLGINYQRPKAAPSEGQIKAAEKAVADLGIEKSLYRRFCTLDEIRHRADWLPPVEKPAQTGGGVFAHLRKDETPNKITGTTERMSWVKFARDLLPEAKKIEFLVTSGRTNYAAFLTSVNPEDPPILKWDHPDNRNPVSWYMEHGGSYPTRFNLRVGDLVEVLGVFSSPSSWTGDFPQ